MNKIRLLLFHILCPVSVFAAEPGYLRNENPPPSPAPLPAVESVVTEMDMRRLFAKARGLADGEAQALHFNRVSCSRRIYSQSGWSVEGDADLKVTIVTGELYEAEFPSYLNLRAFDPYQNGIDQIETVVSRQLVNFANWRDGRTLRLFKSVVISYMDPNKPKQTAYMMDEFKVVEDSYPPSYIDKETISGDKKFTFYFLCQ